MVNAVHVLNYEHWYRLNNAWMHSWREARKDLALLQPYILLSQHKNRPLMMATSREMANYIMCSTPWLTHHTSAQSILSHFTTYSILILSFHLQFGLPISLCEQTFPTTLSCMLYLYLSSSQDRSVSQSVTRLDNWCSDSQHGSIFLKMTAFWDLAPCNLTEVDRRFTGVYCLHHQGNDRGSTHLWNGLLQWDYMAMYSRTLSSSYSLLWEPELSHSIFLLATSIPGLGSTHNIIQWVLGFSREQGSWSWPVTTSGKEYVELYLHSPIHMHSIVLS
jgi:hypothetical protein